MTLEEVLRMGKECLQQAGIPEPDWNAWYLFSYCFHLERGRYFLCSGETAAEENIRFYEELIRKRKSRIPLEYIIHETKFMGLPFQVNEQVLIPRQDTECLVEEVLKISEGKEILDLCTGSGCIGISLAKLGKCKSVTLSDISGEALAAAGENARENQVEVRLIQSDLFESIPDSFDIIVSNPPYIPSGEWEKLMPEVREHEPKLALDGGGDGLVFYRSIIEKIGCFLRPEGSLFFEIGWNQGVEVSRMMVQAGFDHVEVKKDLAGLDRIVQGQYRK